MSKFASLRQEYKKHQLSELNALTDPLAQFDIWFHEAIEAGVMEPNAFTLATVGENGTPSARVLLLKGVDSGGFVFYTNYKSDKAKDIKQFPVGAMVFLWLELERQVRISGPITKVSREESEAYFHSRPRESQVGAWVSPQSQVISSRDVIEKNLVSIQEKFKDMDVIPLPDNWGGYRLMPVEIEFWQGRPNRLHDRLLYSEHEDGGWKIERLAP
jgi:pyridoxamine 5'-phosphate oxidase